MRTKWASIQTWYSLASQQSASSIASRVGVRRAIRAEGRPDADRLAGRIHPRDPRRRSPPASAPWMQHRSRRSSRKCARWRSSPTDSPSMAIPSGWRRSASRMSMAVTASGSSRTSDRRGSASRSTSASATLSFPSRDGSTIRVCSIYPGLDCGATDRKPRSPRNSTRWSSSAPETAACATFSTSRPWRTTSHSKGPSWRGPLRPRSRAGGPRYHRNCPSPSPGHSPPSKESHPSGEHSSVACQDQAPPELVTVLQVVADLPARRSSLLAVANRSNGSGLRAALDLKEGEKRRDRMRPIPNDGCLDAKKW